MIFIELFVPKGALDPGQKRRVAERLGSIEELGAGTEGESTMAAGPAAVFGALFHVVVHEPDVWVVGERALGPEDRPRFLVRVHVPGPWRKDMSEILISDATRIIAEECCVVAEERGVGAPSYSDPAHSDLDVQVHVVGVSEGSIGLGGAVTTSQGIVDLMNRPLVDAAARGEALEDPVCGMLVPLGPDAVTLEWDGELLAFCCRGCRDGFVEKRHRAAARG